MFSPCWSASAADLGVLGHAAAATSAPRCRKTFVKNSRPHLKFSDTVNNCLTFVYMLLLDCWGCLLRAAQAALTYVDANVVAVFYINVTLIVMSDTSVLSKQFLCMPKKLLHSVRTFASTNIFI